MTSDHTLVLKNKEEDVGKSKGKGKVPTCVCFISCQNHDQAQELIRQMNGLHFKDLGPLILRVL